MSYLGLTIFIAIVYIFFSGTTVAIFQMETGSDLRGKYKLFVHLFWPLVATCALIYLVTVGLVKYILYEIVEKW
jgi:hypothetical protein